MKTLFSLILAIFGLASSLQAQTYTLQWGSSFSPAWATGLLTGTANNIGGSGIKCSVSMVNSGGVFTTVLGSMGGTITPTVSASTITVANSATNVQIAMDYADNTEYTDIVFTFNKPAFNVKFNIADIDKLTSTTNFYMDRVTVTGYNGAMSGSPTITKYDATTDPNFLIISGGSAWVNPISGMADNSASSATDQRGTIKVAFNNVYITSFKIRYDNHPSAQADPTTQYIAIGDISFQKSIPLPVTLSSFDGQAKDNGSELNWTTSTEINFDHFVVERSENGVDFSSIGQITGKGWGNGYVYNFKDSKLTAPQYFYRLKMVDQDGSYTYSKIISINIKKYVSFKVYPTVVQNDFSIALYVPRAETLQLRVTNMVGAQVCQMSQASGAGTNEFKMRLPASLPPGQYMVTLENYAQTTAIIKR